MSRCVCTHIKALHVNGVCQARINPCGCTSYETPEQADKPALWYPVHRPSSQYDGRYGRRYKA